jgi:hypothetical protein
MRFRRTSEFEKDLKRLAKKYRTLPDDVEEFMKVVGVQPLGIGKNFAIITKQTNLVVLKARLFCRGLKGNSLRIIYAYRENHSQIELVGIEFIELYFKGDKENEDRDRIQEYLKTQL